MTIPTRAEAARMLMELQPDDWLVTHSTAVAEVASFLADAIQQQGHAIFVSLVEAAALLHDVDKALPREHPLKPLPHGEGGAEWLRERGHDELAESVANHPVMRLADDGHYLGWIAGATIEERVVAYADKRATQDVVTLDQRFARWYERHGRNEARHLARERAGLLEQEVCNAAGLKPEDVRRAPWVADAMGEAGMNPQPGQ